MGAHGVAAALVAAAFSIGAPHTSLLGDRTNVAQLARATSPRLRAGDLVVSTRPEQVPALVRYLRPGLRYATPTGRLHRPAVTDWRGALASPQGLASHGARAVRAAKKRWTRDLRDDAQLVPVGRFTREPRRGGDPPRRSAPLARVTLGSARGRPIPRTFLGLSIEWDSTDAYAGPPGHRHAALASLLGELRRARRAPLALRVGGDSGDQSWWNPAHRRRPRTVLQDVTPATLQSVAWLARALGGPVTLGLNLALRDPANARALATAAARRLPRGALRTLEIGNEPDLYSRGRTFHVPGKVHRRLRKHAVYTPPMYGRDVARYLRVLGPVLPHGARFGVASFAGPAWWSRLPGMLRRWGTRRVAILAHLYALPSCTARTPPAAWLESPAASRGVVAKLGAIVGFAGRHRLPLRVTELNSAACGGRSGLSNRFPAALWLADTLFALARRGVAQVDVHTWNHARYAPFALTGDHARARPPFAGLLAFARGAPSGSRLASVRVRDGHGLRAWATVDAHGVRRILLIAPHAVRASVGGGCSRLWRASSRGTSVRRTCSSRISLPATSLAVMTRAAPRRGG
jgi:hypothetical protein